MRIKLDENLPVSLVGVLREPIEGKEREAFIEEMTALLANYLFGPRPPLRARD